MQLTHPPQNNGVQLSHSTTLRFVVKTAFSGGITFQNILDSYLVATGAATGVQLFQTVRIRRVRIWALPVIGAATSVSLEFGGVTAGVTGDQMIRTDTSMGIEPAHIDARPNARCLAAEYQLSSAAIAFNMAVPVGAVVDLELSWRGQFSAPTALANALVGATAGQLYLRGLDGLATATTSFTPEYVVAQQ